MSHIIKTHTYCLLPIRSLTNMAQKSKDEKQTYEHYIKPARVIDNFEEVYKLEHRLIRSYDELYNFYKNEFKPNTFFAWDTETTSLNAEQGAKTGDLVEGKIVGYSFTQDGHIGYYVPVSHPDYSLGYKALKILYAMICRSKLNLLYNCRFDMRFLEAMTPEKYDYTPEPDEKIYKFDLSGIKYIDVQNTVWLADTNLAMPSLKKSEKHFLGWNPPTFSETIGDESNFGYLPAEQGYKYASIDALGTYHLFFKTEKYYAESGAAAKLDNDLLYPLMRLENTPINVDHEYLQSMRGDVLKHLEELKKYLFETAGREYNINSGRELVTVFQQLGIDTGKRTKTGIMETNIKAIEGYVASHGDSEYLNKLVEYKKLLKFDNSYLEKMLEMSEAENVAKHPIRFCYFTNRVPTGRLASGTDGKNSYFSKLNFQCLKYDTRVITKNGIKQIKDIITGDLVWDGSKYTPCIQLGSKAKELIKVSCGNGHYLEASKEHQVYAIKDNNVGWYKLGDLTCDDYIAINRKYENTDDVITTINKGNVYNPLGGIKHREIHIDSTLYDFWFLCGYLVGDGCFFKYKDHYCGFGLCVPKLKETAMERLKRGFNEVGIIPFEQANTKKGYAPTKSLCTKSANLAEALIDMGFKHLAKNKCIPDVVFNLSPRQKFAFIDGMISTDGTIGTSICYKTTSQQLAYDLRDLLETVGYYSTITETENSVYNIIIHDKYRFRSEIGLTVSYKNESLHSTISTNKKCGLPYKYFNKLKCDDNHIMSNNLDELELLGYTEATYGWKKISNIESIGEDIVYDLYVEESHRFTANGFIVHNSLPKPHSHNYHVHKATPEQIANGEDLCGYIFNDDPEGSLGLAEGQDPHLNVRKAFCPIDNDSVVVSVDMCAEELRLVANIYKEQTWIKAFNSGQDVHRSTACKIFGEENYCKEARKKAKCISGDSLLYTDMGIIKIRDINPNRIEGLPIDVDFNISTPEGVCRCSKFIYNGVKKTLKFNMSNGTVLEVTPDHLVRSDNKWVRADSLSIGDYIDFEPTGIDSNNYKTIDLSYINGAKLTFSKEHKKHYMIESIENSSTDVYDLTIENESHSFLANGFVVHNCASFGILYGSSAYGFHNQFPDMTLEECEEFIEKFKAALPSIEAGQKASVRYAKKNGFVKTYFGRPRRVKYYLNHPDRSMRSFGERTVKNTAVQGAAGDCLKLMLIRLWKELFSKYPEIKWVGSIHDEITYIIPKSILIDALKIIKKCQTIKLPDWPVQLDCDISIGRSFGELIPWFLDDETGELTPQLEEIKHEQPEEKSENKVNEYDMLLDADEYDYLQ